MRLKPLLGLIILALTTVACSQNREPSAGIFMANAGEGIIGGEPVPVTDPIASHTALLIDIHRGSICTMSILSNEWLLTAAHCVSDSQPSSLLIAFSGTLDEVVKGEYREDVRTVVEVRAHALFAETMDKLNKMFETAKAEGRELTTTDLDAVKDWGDIALVRISGVIPEGKKASHFLPSNTPLFNSQDVVLAGYGRTGNTKDASSGELRKVGVKIVESAWGTTEVLMNNAGKGACHGDSGGPAYVYHDGQYVLFGITSRGVADGGQCDRFSAYTNALAYLPWIQSIVGL